MSFDVSRSSIPELFGAETLFGKFLAYAFVFGGVLTLIAICVAFPVYLIVRLFS